MASILMLNIQPSPDNGPKQFSDWFKQNIRPQFRETTTSCSCYHAMDVDQTGGGDTKPEWMVVNNVTDPTRVQETVKPDTSHQSTQSDAFVERKLFKLVQSWKASTHENADAESIGDVVVALQVMLKPERGGDELERWYAEEHVPMLSKVSGWHRTRLFTAMPDMNDAKERVEYFTMHQYASENGLKSSEFQAALQTPKAKDIMSNATKKLTRRLYNLQLVIE